MRTTISISTVLAILLVSCKKDHIDFDEDYVASIEIFDESGGRSDWCETTNVIVYDQENSSGGIDVVSCNPDKSNFQNLTSDMTGNTIDGQYIESWQYRGQPTIHPSGDYIAFQVMNEHADPEHPSEELLSLGVNNDLWIMKSDGSQKQKLTDNPDGYAVLHPHFSHDGNMIAWAERYNADESSSIFGSWRIRVGYLEYGPDDSVSMPVTEIIEPVSGAFYEMHSFSEDDSKFYFSGNLTTDHKANDIYVYDFASESIDNITNSPSHWQEMYNICPTDPGTYSYISSDFFDWNNEFGWGTLRTELYINDNGTTKQLTYYNQRKKDSEKKLTKEHYFIGDHCWSPDGKIILAVLAEAKVGSADGRLLKISLK